VSPYKVLHAGLDGYPTIYYIQTLTSCGFANRNESLQVAFVDEVTIQLGAKETTYYLKLVKVDKMDKGKDQVIFILFLCSQIHLWL